MSELVTFVKKKQSAGIAYIILMIAAVFLGGCSGKLEDLTVDYQNNPIGIDNAAPSFGWKMKSRRTGAAQANYRIAVATSRKDLRRGNYVFDSGKIESDVSAGISYVGKPLKPCTGYYWTVEVFDKDNHSYMPSRPAYFETGLAVGRRGKATSQTDWSDAKWIGSQKTRISPYRTNFLLEYSLKISEGSKASFIFGARDTLNYVRIMLDKKSGRLIISHYADGVPHTDASYNVGRILKNHGTNIHNVKLNVNSVQYALAYKIIPKLDGKSLAPVKIVPFPADSLVYKCRLYKIGYEIPSSTIAEISNIKISSEPWNTVLYASENSERLATGKEGRIFHLWQPGSGIAAPMLRREISVRKRIKKARLYVTARGIYEFFINGKCASDYYFNPGWTDYRKRIMYNTYDVTKMIRRGDNALGAVLGNGWWSGAWGYSQNWFDQYGVTQSLLAKLSVTYSDGSAENFVTDGSWKCSNSGPILFDGLLNGEIYDARREVKNWNMPGFRDARWDSANVFAAPPDSCSVSSYIGSPVRQVGKLTAKSYTEPSPGVYLYDLGQNMAGVPQITLKGKAGTEITVRYGEMKYPDSIPAKPVLPYTKARYEAMKGQVYNDNYRGALATDKYILKGGGTEVFSPRFTCHGFRFIEISGLKKPLSPENVAGLVLASVGPQTSGFETSEKKINRLFENIVWGQRGNFLSIPTDCPQRDERMGWTGDAQVFSRSATYNMNTDPFYSRWLQTVRDDQGDDGNYANYFPVVGDAPSGGHRGTGCPGWTDAGIIVPWQVYQQYGDTSVLRENYASMKKYLAFMEGRAKNFIQPFGGFGDWLAPEYTNSMLINTAYFAYDARIMESVASILGHIDDSMHYGDLYGKIKKAFNADFVNEEGFTVAPPYAPDGSNLFHGNPTGKTVLINTQTSYVLPLQFGLFSDSLRPQALKHLVDKVRDNDYTISTGFLGTPLINKVLSDNGYDSLAYKLFEQKRCPGWLYPVEQGATTIWERWNSYTKVNGFGPVNMNSFNHYSYGAIEEWMMAYCIGIERNEDYPGYKRFILQPRIGGTLSYAKGFFDSPYGRIESGWEKTPDGYVYSATVPANTSCELYLPGTEMISVEKGEDGIFPPEGPSGNSPKGYYRLSAGKYVFSVKM